MPEYWEVVPGGSDPSTLLSAKDPQGWRSAKVKRDGCIDYYRYFELPMGVDARNDEQESDYLHICDLDEEIARLQALRELISKRGGS